MNSLKIIQIYAIATLLTAAFPVPNETLQAISNAAPDETLTINPLFLTIINRAACQVVA